MTKIFYKFTLNLSGFLSGGCPIYLSILECGKTVVKLQNHTTDNLEKVTTGKWLATGINWRAVTKEMLATVVEKLNNRPRKCLNYQTPNEVFLKHVGGAL